MHRLYENENLVIFWDSDKCFHAKRCVHGSPETFDPKRKPWIELGKAKDSEIWKAISECPSKALTCVYRHDVDVKMDEAACRSVAFDGDREIGECEYQKTGDGWNIYHTGVRPEYEGKGIAKRLVFKILEESERQKERVSASCSYAKKVLSESGTGK